MSRSRLVMVSIVAMAFAVRMWAANELIVIKTDGSHYGTLARYALEGSWRDALDPAWPPLYPWFTSLVARLLEGDITVLAVERAAELVSILAGTLVLLPVWELARRWRGPALANLAILLLAFHPNAVRYSAYEQSDSLYLLLFVSSIFAFVSARRGNRATSATMACAGFLVALAVLTRPEGWSLVAVFTLVLISDRKHRLQLVPLILPIALILTPWLVYLAGETGSIGLGAKAGMNFYLGHADLYAEHGIEVKHSDVLSIRGLGDPWNNGEYHIEQLVRAAPLSIAFGALVTALGALFDKLPSIVSWSLLILALIGFRRGSQEREGLPDWFPIVLGLLATAMVLYAPFFILQRFFLPFLPFALIGSAATLLWVSERATRHRTKVLVGLVLSPVLVMIAFTSYFLGHFKMHTVYRDAGEWLRAESTETHVLLAGYKPEPAFYGEVEYRRVVAKEPERIAKFLRDKNATHFYLRSPGVDERLTAWLEPGQEPAWLTHRVEFEARGERLVLWRVAPPE